MSKNTQTIDPSLLTPVSVSKLIQSKSYVCAGCGVTILGEIPFKMHVMSQCPGGAIPVQLTPVKPQLTAPADELKRMLRAKTKPK